MSRYSTAWSNTRSGCAEFGEQHGGFVVETPGDDDRDPFLLRCTDNPDLDRHTEEQRYQIVLANVGFHTVTRSDGDEGGLAVWLAGVRPKGRVPHLDAGRGLAAIVDDQRPAGHDAGGGGGVDHPGHSAANAVDADPHAAAAG